VKLSILAYSADSQHMVTYSCSRPVERLDYCSLNHLIVDVYSHAAEIEQETLNYFGRLVYSKLCLPRVDFVRTRLVGEYSVSDLLICKCISYLGSSISPNPKREGLRTQILCLLFHKYTPSEQDRI